MRFTSGLLFDLRGRSPSDVVAKWRVFSDEFFSQFDHRGLVELIVTDRFESVVAQWQRDTPRALGGEGAVGYRAGKADGTRASAKTVPLAEQCCVVVVGVDAIELGDDMVRWMLVHEAQHVLLHQQEASAYAVQRRLDQQIESPRPWLFVFAAQNSIDEFRCERAVYGHRGGREPTYGPDDAARVIGQLRAARSASRTDLDRAYEIVVQVVDRLAVMAAYTAAAVDAGSDDAGRWAGVPELTTQWEYLRQAPEVGDRVSSLELWASALDLSRSLDLALRGHRIELIFEGDGVAVYFR